MISKRPFSVIPIAESHLFKLLGELRGENKAMNLSITASSGAIFKLVKIADSC